MRLLSFLTLVENHLVERRPECADGWTRRVNYFAGTACFTHPMFGLTLTLSSCLLADGQHNLNASWHGASGEVVATRSFFSGNSGFQWSAAAAAVTDLMPSPALPARAATPETRAEEPGVRELIPA